MSTKIYNGLILRNSNLEQALGLLIGIRAEFISNGQKYVASEVARRIALEKDLAVNYCTLDKGGQSAFWALHEKFHEAQVDVLGRGVRSVDWDATLSICLIPHQGNVLALHYSEGSLGYRKLLLAAGFEDFHYQDSSDGPEDVPADEWSERGDTWLKVLRGGTVPADVGVTYEAVSWECLRGTLFDKNLVASCAPSQDVRRREVALRLTELGPGEKIDFKVIGLSEGARRLVELAKLRLESVVLSDNPFNIV